MAIYTYNDDFIVNSVDGITLDNAELKAINEVKKLNISDVFYKEKLIVSKVYSELALIQLENDGMELKYKSYIKEFDRYISLSKTNSSTSNISSMPISRG